MKILVIGGGLIGSAIARDLSAAHEVTCADRDAKRLQWLTNSFAIQALALDAADEKQLKEAVKPFELVVGAVPGFMGFRMLKHLIDAGKDVVDISFFPENALELNDLAIKQGVCAIVDCGVAPGMSNLIAGYHYSRMKMSRFECLVGGLPVVREFPYEYKAVFSPIDVIEEYTRPARFISHGQMVAKEALSDVEEMFFEGVGTVEAFNTDGLRSLAHTLPGVPHMIERTLRYPGHARLMRALRETGFFGQRKEEFQGGQVSPIEMTARLMFAKWKMNAGDEDLTLMRVTAEGEEEGRQVRHTYTLLDRFDKATQTTSMARTTAYTCTAAVNLLASGLWKRAGVCPPEYMGESQQAFDFIKNYLAERDVVYHHRKELAS